MRIKNQWLRKVTADFLAKTNKDYVKYFVLMFLIFIDRFICIELIMLLNKNDRKLFR